MKLLDQIKNKIEKHLKPGHLIIVILVIGVFKLIFGIIALFKGLTPSRSSYITEPLFIILYAITLTRLYLLHAVIKIKKDENQRLKELVKKLQERVIELDEDETLN